jgi:hypothetical protein
MRTQSLEQRLCGSHYNRFYYRVPISSVADPNPNRKESDTVDTNLNENTDSDMDMDAGPDTVFLKYSLTDLQ